MLSLYVYQNYSLPVEPRIPEGASEATRILAALVRSRPSQPRSSMREPEMQKTFDTLMSVRTLILSDDYEAGRDYRLGFEKVVRDQEPTDTFSRYETAHDGTRYDLTELLPEVFYPHTEMITYTAKNAGNGEEMKTIIYDFQLDDVEHPLIKEYSYLTSLSGTGIAPEPLDLSPPQRYFLRERFWGSDRFLIADMIGPGLEMHAFKHAAEIGASVAVQIGAQLVGKLKRLHHKGIVHGRIALDTIVKNPEKEAATHGDIDWLLVDFANANFHPEPDGHTVFSGLRDDVWNVLDIIGKLSSGHLDACTIGPVTGYYKWMKKEKERKSFVFNSPTMTSPLPESTSAEHADIIERKFEHVFDMVRSLNLHEMPDHDGIVSVLQSIVDML